MNINPDYILYAKSIIGMLAIANPLGAVPIFLSMTSDRTSSEKKHIAHVTALSVAIILIASIWAGTALLSFFGISISAFKTGGGLLILLMAISMLRARQSHTRQTPTEADEASAKESIAVVPLAIPIIAGPGAISLVIVDAHKAANFANWSILSVDVLILAFLIWLALRLATPIGNKLGTTGLNIATRIMGLILAAIGIEMITSGLTKLLPGLAA